MQGRGKEEGEGKGKSPRTKTAECGKIVRICKAIVLIWKK
jgi:hypothetical protein